MYFYDIIKLYIFHVFSALYHSQLHHIIYDVLGYVDWLLLLLVECLKCGYP